VTDCEEKLADHINLVHAQDSKLSALEKLVAKQATKIEKLSARVKSVEKKVPEAGDIETMQHSIAELTDRVNNRSTYIRTEIKKQWNDVRTPYEQEQARVNTRLDSFRDDLAVQKVRVEDCQKAVDEHIKKRKDHGIELSALEETVRKKSRIRRRQIEKLSDRVSELEGKLSGRQPVAADPDDEDTDEEDAPQMEARLASLTERIAELERKQELHRQEQETAIDNIWKRLNKVENSHANLKKTSKANHAALEEQAKDHETRLTRQKRGTSSRNNQLANVGLQVRNSARGHWSAAPSGSYIRFTD
jgi:chromosome segregation ATPase